MRRLALILAAFLAFGVVLSPATAGPNCAKNPQAGPCKPKPTPSPSVTPTPAVTSPTPTTPSPTVTSPGVFTPPGSIDRTGTVDVSTQLTSWLQTVPNGSTADLGSGTYRVERAVRVTDRTGLTIRGGTLVRKTTSTDPALSYPNENPLLYLLRPSGVTVAGTAFRSTNTVSDNPDYCPACGTYDVRWEFDAAIRAESFTNLTLTGLDIDAVWGDGIQLQIGTGAFIGSTRIARNGRQGIAVLASQVVIDGVDIVSSRRSGIDLEPDTANQAFGDVTIRNTHIWSWLLAITAGGPGAFTDVNITDVSVTHSGVPVVNADSSDGGDRSRWHILRLNTEGAPLWRASSSLPVLYFANSRGSTVDHSTVPIHWGSVQRIGVGAYENSSVVVDTSWFENAERVADTDVTSTVTVTNTTTGTTPPAGL